VIKNQFIYMDTSFIMNINIIIFFLIVFFFTKLIFGGQVNNLETFLISFIATIVYFILYLYQKKNKEHFSSKFISRNTFFSKNGEIFIK